MTAGCPLVLIAAVARNGVIGAGGRVPWHIEDDLAHFRARTMGKPILMGRKTFDAIGKPLPGRQSIVVSRDPAFRPHGAVVARSLDEAVTRARALAASSGAADVMVVGGAEIYAALMRQATELDVTEVDLAPAGDALFTAIDPGLWREVERRRGVAAPEEPAHCFVRYIRDEAN